MGGVTVLGGVPDPWGYGTGGHGQWAYWCGLELGLGILEVFSNLNDSMILRVVLKGIEEVTFFFLNTFLFCRTPMTVLTFLKEQMIFFSFVDSVSISAVHPPVVRPVCSKF